MAHLLLKRGTSEETRKYIGNEGEITIDTTNWSLRVHDGKTPGGFSSVGYTVDSIIESPLIDRNDPFLNDAIEDYEKTKKELLIRIKMMLE